MDENINPGEQLLEIVILEVVDIEEYAKRREDVPHAKKYRFRVDDHYYVTDHHELNGREILAFAGKTPEAYMLRQRLKDGKVEAVAPDQIVDLKKHGIERFKTVPKENTDGEVPGGD